MAAPGRKRRLQDAYVFPGLGPERAVRGVFGAFKARIIRLTRRAKKRCAANCGTEHNGWCDRTVRRVRDLSRGDRRIFLEFDVRRVLRRPCGKVKRELLEFLADNTHFTKRLAYFVGRRRRQATIKDVAKELNLD